MAVQHPEFVICWPVVMKSVNIWLYNVKFTSFVYKMIRDLPKFFQNSCCQNLKTSIGGSYTEGPLEREITVFEGRLFIYLKKIVLVTSLMRPLLCVFDEINFEIIGHLLFGYGHKIFAMGVEFVMTIRSTTFVYLFNGHFPFLPSTEKSFSAPSSIILLHTFRIVVASLLLPLLHRCI